MEEGEGAQGIMKNFLEIKDLKKVRSDNGMQ